MSACEQGFQWLQALDLLAQMQDDALEPDAITYSYAMNTCQTGAQWLLTLQLLDEMHGLS